MIISQKESIPTAGTHILATDTGIMVFAECYQTLILFCREKISGSNAPKIIGIDPVFAKLQVIDFFSKSDHFQPPNPGF